MPVRLELSLQELVRVALGVPEIGTVNIAVLHSLLNIILKKLNCQDEKVTIGGFESKCVEKLLDISKMSPLPFDDEDMVPISVELSKIAILEEQVAKLEKRLEDHFDQIRACNRTTDVKYQSKFWEQFASPCEDLCTTCDEDNKIACALLQNMDFMKKLMRRVATPIVDRLMEISEKLTRFYAKLQEFFLRTEDIFKRLELVKQCIIEIEKLRQQVTDANLTFIGTMEELQDMLDAKLDKVHMPALKKYIRDRFDDIDNRLQSMESKSTCPRAAGFIQTDIKCLSCGNTKIGVDVGPHIISVLPDAHPHPNSVEVNTCNKTMACRIVEKEPTLRVRIQNLDLNVLSARLNRPSLNGKVCKLPEANDTIYGVRTSM